MSRISNRRYPAITCKNPACKKIFKPHDRRQKFCEIQCRVNYHNDKRYFENSTRFKDEKQSRVNNKILEKIWSKFSKNKEKIIPKASLELEDFNFNSQTLIKQNSKTNRNILWYHDFGLELVSKDTYEIHRIN